jgi:hypothetical protein
MAFTVADPGARSTPEAPLNFPRAAGVPDPGCGPACCGGPAAGTSVPSALLPAA